MCLKRKRKRENSQSKIGGKPKVKRKFPIKDCRKAKEEENSRSKIGRKQKQNMQNGHQQERKEKQP